MSLLDNLTPTNLLEEKAKFLADPTYNPQFIYEVELPKEELYFYGLPQKKYLTLAQDMLDRAYFGRNENDLLMSEGPLLTQQEVHQRCQAFLDMHGLQRYQIIWSGSFVSRASITNTTLKLRTNAEYRKESVIGMIYHELGTHAIRRVNYEQQPWFKAKKKVGLTTSYLRTEEGLAILHALLPRSNKSAYITAIRYLANAYSQEHSLAEVWNFLGKYITDTETRWMVTFRQKRGMSDTSQPGGFTKDIVYFEGVISTWQWLMQHNGDITDLYIGKIAWEDAAKARQLSPKFDPLLPSFYTLDPAKYLEDIHTIGIENQFDRVA